MTSAPSKASALEWAVGVPVLWNPILFRQALTIFGLAPLLPLSLIGLAWLPDGSFGLFLQMVELLYGLTFGLVIAAFLLTALIYRNGIGMRFRMDERGFAVAQDDRRSRVIAKATVVLGAVTVNPAMAGAGLLANSSSDVSGHWSALKRARFHDRLHAIELRNRWRTVAVLYCDASSYPEIAAYVRAHVAVSHREEAGPRLAPPIRGLAWTLFVIVCLLPAFFLQAEIGTGLKPLMVTTAFAAATVWLLSILAWPLLVGLLWTAATFAVDFLGGTRSATPDIMALGSLTALGFAALAVFAVFALRGGFSAVLQSDLSELDNDR